MKILVLADTHCGSVNGLTPPDYHNEKRQGKIIKTVWDWYVNEAKEINADIAIINGDIVDGPGKKGSIDHITTNLAEQRDMAQLCINEIGAKKHIFTYGTGFHVTQDEDTEDEIAKVYGTKPKTEQTITIDGVRISAKHHTGKTSIPHGQGSLISKRLLWTLLHDTLSGCDRADIVIRSHVHEYCMIETPMGCGITTPCMQIPRNRYGRKYDGWYDVGFLEIITTKGVYYVKSHILNCVSERKYEVIK